MALLPRPIERRLDFDARTFDAPANRGWNVKTFCDATSEEIFPWIRAICQLWDEPERYNKWQNRGFARAERWNFEKIADQYEKTLRDLLKKDKS